MRRPKVSSCDGACPVQRAVEVLDGKWTLLVLRELMGGTRRFGELRRSIGDVNPKTLAERLRALEAHDIVTRKVFPEVPPRVEYTLTAKGKDLAPVIRALAGWGETWTRAS